jgi:hypothetical protein
VYNFKALLSQVIIVSFIIKFSLPYALSLLLPYHNYDLIYLE